jgi:hypothetical protein
MKKEQAPHVSRTTPAPPGFTQYVKPAVGKEPGRVFIRCSKQLLDPRGHLVQCCKEIRKDHLLKEPEAQKKQLSHKCFAQSLDRFLALPAEPPKLPKIQIQQSLLEFGGRFNLSMESVASPAMRNLILTTIREGLEHPNIDAASLYPMTSRRILTTRFIDAVRRLYDHYLREYRAQRYIALSVDGGKLGSSNYLDILITNAYIDAPPLIHKAIRHFRGDFPSYHNEILGAINELEADGFVVSGIVSDNLRVQISAISTVQSDKMNKVIHIPCGCHCLSLAISDFIKQNHVLSQADSCLEAFTKLLNSKPVLSKLKCSCPSRCFTRWTNIYDIADWIVTHIETLNAFFEDPEVYKIKSLQSETILEMCLETMKGASPLLLMLLQVFKVLSLRLENNRTSCGCIYGYEMSALATFQQLCMQYPSIAHFKEEVINAVLRRLGLSASGLLQKVLYTLTPAGREIEIALRSNPTPAVQDSLFSQHFPIEPTPQAAELLHKADLIFTGHSTLSFDMLQFQIREFHGTPPIPIPQTQEELDETLEVQHINSRPNSALIRRNPDPLDEEDEDEVSSSEQIDQQADEELAQCYYNFSDCINDSQFSFDSMGDLLSRHSFFLGLKSQKVTIAYTNWLSSPTRLTRNQQNNIQNDDPMSTWTFFSMLPEFQDLAALALRFLIIPASEAGVEREFWKQRKILTNERVRTGDALAFSRLAFMTLPIPEKE